MKNTSKPPKTVKRCIKCKLVKPVTDFYALRVGAKGTASDCKDCKSQYYKERRSLIRDATRIGINARRKKYAEQGLCIVCGKLRANYNRYCDYHHELARQRVNERKAKNLKNPKTQIDMDVEEQGFVYVLKCAEIYYKIGQSHDVQARLANIRTANPTEIELLHVIECWNMTGAEREIHRYFEDKRHRLEWFLLDEDDLSRLMAIKSIGNRFPQL